ncbi:NUDIX domain-containing protein [Aurantiacibacter poecillastricola]|uniref:NUDIX domain-containing protein n=1 Tax=Aurantiacibacter poecillastricola TaxID=3064385 RepID=UPI00273EA9EA|nr:NUDIX domain-containing protein [Aurantiacibacter sp. 219JJ12-13]MDP5263097.1 NUDIX domain-containing protein [Aurantiacibacter sp. 219JJ12-13]
MLHLIPAPLHRALYRLGHGLRRIFLRHFKGEVHGCCVIGRDGEGRVLLVRHSYGPAVWAFPGGGMRKDEDGEAAALRELHEELRCTLAEPVRLGHLEDMYLGSRNRVQVFTGLIQGEPRPDMREVVEARFFALDMLPDNTSRTVRDRVHLLEQR